MPDLIPDNISVREMVHAPQWMRFQAISNETRPELAPIWGGINNSVLMGHRNTGNTAAVKRLRGWGPTPDRALSMAHSEPIEATNRMTNL